MKVELRFGGQVLFVEAEGAVSFRLSDEVVAAAVAAVVPPVAPVAPAVAAVVPAVAPVVAADVPVPAVVPAVPAPVIGFVPPVVPVPPAVPGSPVQNGEFDTVLFKQLSNLRRELANNAKVPPYIIFHDKTLREMAEKLPADLEALGSIPGVGASKLEKYGERFLSVIRGVVA